VSKNVAVFVDVANIFYAAKAAGVDIDYVTLLKAATAGRDFVRAYAYTGLDPDNENQRNFHQFLSRHGYKVVSKDIRKYGDGKVKANLDIELVVDMLKTARNLDIAVLVSGDGDFAPAVRAVQEMGVRVEVISFRGNTSSDLIEAADQFIDITQIAKVDKTSTRSGRRVAAGEEDLSMTEVPAKQTEGETERARRRRAQARAAAQARATEATAGQEPEGAAPTAQPVSITILPGEKLSKFAGTAPEAGAPTPEVGQPAEGEMVPTEAAEEGGRRRRRRRRRGRGRGAEAMVEPAVPETPTSTRPTHAFGSVWDSQIGMPTAPTTELESLSEEDLEEPEVPEYLLAERKRRGRQPARGGRGGYAAAVERERFGRPAARPEGGAGRREPRPARRAAEPWSEVPPEIEALLRAQLAARGEATSPPAGGTVSPAGSEGEGTGRPSGGEAAAGAPVLPTVSAGTETPAPAHSEGATAPAGSRGRASRSSRRRGRVVQGEAEGGAAQAAGPATVGTAAAEAATATTATAPATATTAAGPGAAEPPSAPVAPTGTAMAEGATTPRRTSRRRGSRGEAAATEPVQTEPVQTEPVQTEAVAPARRRRRRAEAGTGAEAAPGTEEAGATEPAAQGASQLAEAGETLRPRRGGRRRKAAAEPAAESGAEGR
jgi:uncharacterized LabA/DUF88 family protein